MPFYPVTLVQLSTRGAPHNFTPIVRPKTFPAFDGTPERTVPTFRFYFDGLIAHVHAHADDNGETAALGPIIVGAEERLVAVTVRRQSQ